MSRNHSQVDRSAFSPFATGRALVDVDAAGVAAALTRLETGEETGSVARALRRDLRLIAQTTGALATAPAVAAVARPTADATAALQHALATSDPSGSARHDARTLMDMAMAGLEQAKLTPEQHADLACVTGAMEQVASAGVRISRQLAGPEVSGEQIAALKAAQSLGNVWEQASSARALIASDSAPEATGLANAWGRVVSAAIDARGALATLAERHPGATALASGALAGAVAAVAGHDMVTSGQSGGLSVPPSLKAVADGPMAERDRISGPGGRSGEEVAVDGFDHDAAARKDQLCVAADPEALISAFEHLEQVAGDDQDVITVAAWSLDQSMGTVLNALETTDDWRDPVFANGSVLRQQMESARTALQRWSLRPLSGDVDLETALGRVGQLLGVDDGSAAAREHLTSITVAGALFAEENDRLWPDQSAEGEASAWRDLASTNGGGTAKWLGIGAVAGGIFGTAGKDAVNGFPLGVRFVEAVDHLQGAPARWHASIGEGLVDLAQTAAQLAQQLSAEESGPITAGSEARGHETSEPGSEARGHETSEPGSEARGHETTQPGSEARGHETSQPGSEARGPGMLAEARELAAVAALAVTGGDGQRAGEILRELGSVAAETRPDQVARAGRIFLAAATAAERMAQELADRPAGRSGEGKGKRISPERRAAMAAEAVAPNVFAGLTAGKDRDVRSDRRLVLAAAMSDRDALDARSLRVRGLSELEVKNNAITARALTTAGIDLPGRVPELSAGSHGSDLAKAGLLAGLGVALNGPPASGAVRSITTPYRPHPADVGPGTTPAPASPDPASPALVTPSPTRPSVASAPASGPSLVKPASPAAPAQAAGAEI